MTPFSHPPLLVWNCEHSFLISCQNLWLPPRQFWILHTVLPSSTADIWHCDLSSHPQTFSFPCQEIQLLLPQLGWWFSHRLHPSSSLAAFRSSGPLRAVGHHYTLHYIFWWSFTCHIPPSNTSSRSLMNLLLSWKSHLSVNPSPGSCVWPFQSPLFPLRRPYRELLCEVTDGSWLPCEVSARSSCLEAEFILSSVVLFGKIGIEVWLYLLSSWQAKGLPGAWRLLRQCVASVGLSLWP